MFSYIENLYNYPNLVRFPFQQILIIANYVYVRVRVHVHDLVMCRWGEKGGSLIFPRKWMLPSLEATRQQLVQQLNLFKEKDTDLVRVNEEPDRLEVTLDTAQYRPDELEINVEEGKLVIAGSHKEKKGGGGGQRAVSQLKRRYVQLHNCTNNVQVEDV